VVVDDAVEMTTTGHGSVDDAGLDEEDRYDPSSRLAPETFRMERKSASHRRRITRRSARGAVPDWIAATPVGDTAGTCRSVGSTDAAVVAAAGIDTGNSWRPSTMPTCDRHRAFAATGAETAGASGTRKAGSLPSQLPVALVSDYRPTKLNHEIVSTDASRTTKLKSFSFNRQISFFLA